MANLNLVTADVSIAGTQVRFNRIDLSQKFNAHHKCTIEIDYEELDEKWMANPIKFINFIGESLSITFRHRQTGEENIFEGIITNVSFSGYHGNQNSIIITGSSPTVKLDGKPAMDSFMDLPLKQVVEEAVSNSGNGGDVTVKPKFSSKLDYVNQYNESCWEFLNRLSWQFGEWLFYNGQDCYFGLKNGKTTTLVYDKEMSYFDLSANLTPQKFNRRHYLKHDDNDINKDDQPDVPGVHGYLQVSKSRAEKVYTSDVTTPLMADVNTKKDLDDLVLAEKSRAVGEMLVMRGKTQTCKVKIGECVKVELPEYLGVNQSIDTFLVIEVTHIIDDKGVYSNSFTGIVDGIEAIPMAEPKLPLALSQIAIVKDNADPKNQGRVKVQTDWQKAKNKTTNWIRVQTPDAGKSDKVASNRGLVTIPEKDDTVMLGFEFGSPDRPFVAGSIFTSKTGGGGGAGNKNKSLTTRSGSTVTLDDDKGNVLIADQTGNNTIIVDGTDKISVFSTKTIEMSNGKSTISMEDDKILIKAKSIMIDGSDEINLLSGKQQARILNSESMVTISGTTIKAIGDDAEINGKNTVDVSSKIINVKGGEDVNVSGRLVKINS